MTLRIFLCFFALVSTCFSAKAQAELNLDSNKNLPPIWILDDGADAAEFIKFTAADQGSWTWLQYSVLKAEANQRSLDEILSVANLNKKPTSFQINYLQNLESEKPWSLESLYYLRDYSEHLLTSESLSVELRKLWKSQLCHYQVLLQEEILTPECATEVYSFASFKKENPDIQILMWNQQPLNLEEKSQLVAQPNVDYHWTFVTNKSSAQTMRGTASEILKQKIDLQNLVKGNCTEFDVSEKSMPASSQVFFSEKCQRPLAEAGQSAAWYKKKSNIALGLLLVASAVYLHDKTVVVTIPSF